MTDTEMVFARQVRTGDLLVTGTGERVVSHADRANGLVVLHHGPHSHTEMGPDIKVRVRRRARRTEHVDTAPDESAGGHIWAGRAS